jgi:hypothetical protein
MPALTAQTRQPAVSEVHPPRRSRRTPAVGVPSIPAAPPRPPRPPTAEEVAARSESLLAAIVGSLGESAPTRPASITPQDAVPRVMMNQQTGLPANVVAPPPLPPGHHQLPHSGQPPPLPLAAPIQTPNPFLPFPAPVEPPTSISRQLAALQIDELPDAYRIKGPTHSPWLVRGLLAAVVVVGAVIVALALVGDDEVTSARVRFESIPTGATVLVDGKALPDPTPVMLEARPGARYHIEYRLAGYQPKAKDILVEGGGDVTDMALLERTLFRLLVTSSPRADVFVDGVRVGTTPFDRTYVDPPKTVELRLKGYQPKRQALDWTGKTELVLDYVLTR